MTNRLRASSLATLAATMLSFGTPQGSFADGRSDWTGYAWQKIELSKCSTMDAVRACPLYHQKWDWKRNQWVDLAISLDLASGQVSLSQRLANNDPTDQDYVCVTALLIDAAGKDLVAHHQNWQISAGEVLMKAFIYQSSALGTAKTIHIGSKQCRDGGHEDDDTYANVLAAIGN